MPRPATDPHAPGREPDDAAGSGLLKISELAERADVPVATVRHYLREGLLPEPVKTSRNMAYYPPEFAEYVRGRGRKKVMFGSNYPMLTPLQCLADLDGLGLDQEARELFLHGNAERVFGIGEGGTSCSA